MEIINHSLIDIERILAVFIIIMMCILYTYQCYMSHILRKEIKILRHREDEKNHSQMRFLRHINHAIRTPLNGMLGFFDLMQKKDNNPQTKEYRNMCIKSANQLNKILDQFGHYCNMEDDGIKPNQLRQTVPKKMHDPYVL